jgi:hypothetical protein
LSRIIDPADIPSFNDLIKEQISTSLIDEPPDSSTWDDATLAAATVHIPPKKNTPKKPWITQETLDLITSKHKHALEHSSNEAGHKQARKDSAKAVRKGFGNLVSQDC